MGEVICSVEGCAYPVPDRGYICPKCREHLLRDLEGVPTLAGAMLQTYTRTSRFGDGDGGRKSSETPLPFDDRVKPVAWNLHATLTGWARLISEERGIPITCIDTSGAVALWLTKHVQWIAHHKDGATCVDEVHDAVRQAMHLVDRPASKWFAGPCQEIVIVGSVDNLQQVPCPEDLWANPGSTTVICKACEAEHDVAQRRDWLLEAATEYLAHAELIGRALLALGQNVTPGAIAGYKRRGVIAPHGKDREGRDLYRIGDVIDAARTAQARRKGA